MAFFREEDLNCLDWRLLQNGFVNLYWRQNYLHEDVRHLRELGYKILQFDCSSWKTIQDCAQDLNSKLNIEWRGNSMDALNDLLADVDIPAENGLVLAFSKFDFFSKLQPRESWVVLDILASNGRWHLLFGRRLICMLQVDNSTFEFRPVGAQPVLWNPREALYKNRGL
jgi:hypothetical protein